MNKEKSLHSICAWTFNSGKGGFTPADMRRKWKQENLDTVAKIKLIKDKIVPKLPDNIQLGFEMHYDYEFNENNASDIADTLLDSGIYLAMTTPGAHQHWAYGGVASLDSKERTEAEKFCRNALELTYEQLKKAWHPNPQYAPCFVIWNGSFGYDTATPAVKQMYQNLKESIAQLCRQEEKKGGKLFIGIEPKPNEGHPAMLLPTVASSLLFWRRIEEEFSISRNKKGVNKEFGHSEMIGLDCIYDTIEELDNNAMVHMHLNCQGLSDGITLGGPGKFDIDHGVKINGINIAVARLLQDAGYARWKGHDIQVRPYDSEEQGVDRIVRSILSWEACEHAAREIDINELMQHLSKRNTAKAEDIMRQTVVKAQHFFDNINS
ncbi:MAG: xylose isomerase [Planctomycetota bacterium]